MTSLSPSIQSLRRFPPNRLINVSDAARFVGMEPPISVSALINRINALPDSVPFHSTIVTGTAMGGEVNITLHRDGSYRFSGFMRATGLLSFSFRVSAIIRSANNELTVAAQHSGKVFGTDTPGDRQNNWDEPGTDADVIKSIRNFWPDVSSGTMVVSRSSELSGVIATASDIIQDVAKFFVLGHAVGVQLAICLVIGSELERVGVTLPGFGGVLGLCIVAGSVFIFGPGSLIQAMVVGIGVGAIVDAMVKIRRLTSQEIEFARVVFGDSLNFDRIRLTNLSGLGARDFTFPTIDGTILLNIGNAIDDPSTAQFPDPTDPNKGYPKPGQLFIHELTHVWQYEHASFEDGYSAGQMCDGIGEQTTLGSDAYKYGPAGQEWSSFHMEAQAAIVDQWFAGIGARQKGSPMDTQSKYFPYISNNIRMGIV